MKDNSIEGLNNSIPKGRVERWERGYSTIIGQDPENRGKTLGVVAPDGVFYPLEEGEQFIQKPLNNPEPYIRLFYEEDIPFAEWIKRKS